MLIKTAVKEKFVMLARPLREDAIIVPPHHFSWANLTVSQVR